MKRIILAGGCLAALCGSASAQGLTVNDPASILVQAKQLAQEAQTYLLKAQSYATQLQQYGTEAQQLENFVHAPSLGAAMGLMDQAGLGNSLPVNPMALQSLTSGYGSLTNLSAMLGKLSQLNGLVNTNFAANHIYTPNDGSLASQQLNGTANSIAGTQAAIQSAYEDLRNHLPIIQALRDKLANATNMKDVADAQAQLSAETTWTQNMQGSISAMQANYQVQRDSREQRDNETFDQSADAWLAKAKAAGRGL